MAARSGLRSRLTEIATCPICLEDFRDPRSLPCVHSFCLPCLQGHCKDKCLGDDVLCPLCRKEFQIPQGLEALPENFFLENLLEAKDIKKRKSGSEICEACSTNKHVKFVEVYCVDCNQQLCERCSVPHRKWKGGAHDVRPVGEELSAWLVHQHGCFCKEHPDKRLELYCFDCNVNICMECFALFHQQHKFAEIEEAAKKFVASIQAHNQPLLKRISLFHGALKEVEIANITFLKTMGEIEQNVQQRATEIKRLADDHVTKLMQEINEVKATSVKETRTQIDSLELALTALESFQAYSSELTSKGSASDITRAANDLLARADEVLKTHVVSGDYCFPDVRFVPSDTDVTTGGSKTNIVGSLLQLKSPRVIHTFREAKNVKGVTQLNKELYMYVASQQNVEQLRVYSTSDFTLLSHISVPGVSGKAIEDMTSCGQKKCVYLADSGNTCVHRLGLDTSVSKWSVKSKPWGLSVTSNSSLLVTCHDGYGNDGELLVLRSDNGHCVQTIKLNVASPWHAVQLSTGEYVVCHGSIKNDGVSKVGSDGKVVRRNTADGGLHLPCHLAVYGDQFVFLVDEFSHRIALFDTSLNYIRNVIERVQNKPKRLCFDGVARRLYVGQHDGIVSVVQM